jgi:hypothetical protein
MLNDNTNRISQNCRLLILTILLARLIILASRYSKVLTISKNLCWALQARCRGFHCLKKLSLVHVFLALRLCATLASQSARLFAFPAHVRQCVLSQIELTQRRSHLTKSPVQRRDLATKVPLRPWQFRIKRLISRQRQMNFSASPTVTSEMPLTLSASKFGVSRGGWPF